MNHAETDSRSFLHHGWALAPERAAVDLETRTAVIADLHLGYEWARGSAGDCVPRHSLAETLDRLAGLFARHAVERLIIAGDLVESTRPCESTLLDVTRLMRWLHDRGIELVALMGNHDLALARRGVAEVKQFAPRERFELRGWTIAHGHKRIAAARLISGHEHPVLRFEGLTAPCFLVADDMIVLPAFSSNASGRDVARGRIPERWARDQVRCVAAAEDRVLELGPLGAIRAAHLQLAVPVRGASLRPRRRSRKNP